MKVWRLSRLRHDFSTHVESARIEASDQIPHPLRVVIKFPSSRAGKGVKCPGNARGWMLKLRFDWYIMAAANGYKCEQLVRFESDKLFFLPLIHITTSAKKIRSSLAVNSGSILLYNRPKWCTLRFFYMLRTGYLQRSERWFQSFVHRLFPPLFSIILSVFSSPHLRLESVFTD